MTSELIERESISPNIFLSLINITKKAELGEAIAMQIKKLNIYDLQAISSKLERDVNELPSPYRENIRPYFYEQYFGRYYKILELYNNGSIEKIQGDIKDIELFRDFCRTAIGYQAYFEKEIETGQYGPFQGMYYFLVSCFMMFALEEPGHPVGMPFPGGFYVAKENGTYYCPIREKEKDVEYSICNFCPAKQSPE